MPESTLESQPSRGWRAGALPHARSDRTYILAAIAFATVYALAGLVGHDPWKQDEAYVFGGIYHILQTGDWVVPHVAGEPFMEKPPLYHLVAAALAHVFSPWLTLHDGARLASGLFVGVSFLSIAWAARELWGRRAAVQGVVLAIATVGSLVESHLINADVALMGSIAVAGAGFVACGSGRRYGGLAVGLGAGMGFLAKGLLGPGVVMVTAAALPVVSSQWRTTAYRRQMSFALLAALPWLVIWPVALHARSPRQFGVWFWDNNIGRFLGYSVPSLGAAHEPWLWTETYPWFLFPVWIFVVAQLWRLRSRWRDFVPLHGLVVMIVVFMAVLAVSATGRSQYAMPIVPLAAMIGAGAVGREPRWVDRTLATLGVVFGSVAITGVVYVWWHMVSTGRAPEWAWLVALLPERFPLHVTRPALVTVTLVITACLGFIHAARDTAGRGLRVWAVSLTLVFGLFMTLWGPWLNGAKSYRAMFDGFPVAVAESRECLASEGFGESERAMLDYFRHVVTMRREVANTSECGALLVQRTRNDPPAALSPDWRLVWNGHRPGDRRELFELFVRDGLQSVRRPFGRTPHRLTNEKASVRAGVHARVSIVRAAHPASSVDDAASTRMVVASGGRRARMDGLTAPAAAGRR
ncbi:MAG: hypothetical protein GC151_14755 [Betaproteobacteria bacterium]|nr:hypothetical protein [Betaproteobacteria bacterium]